MTDYFALLSLPRRPWLERDLVQARFHTLSGELHPDRVTQLSAPERAIATTRYAELNTAHQCLRDLKSRLGHLLELELGGQTAEMRDIPPALADLFLETGQMFRQLDAFLKERETVVSPLLRVSWFQKGMVWDERLRNLQSRVRGSIDALEAETRTLDTAWPNELSSGPIAPLAKANLPRLGEIYRSLALLNRWLAQIQDRAVKLIA